MHNPFEELPEIDYCLGFPGGDISFSDVASATALLEELKQGGIETQREALTDMRNAEIEDWRLLPGQEKNYQALMNLTEDWDYTIQGDFREKEIAQISTFTTLAFIKRSELITVEFCDFSKELETLGELDGQAIMEFAQESWPSMGRTHTLLFNELLPFIVQLEKVNDTRSADIPVRFLLGASAALPYLMANTTHLLGDLDIQLQDKDLHIK